MTSGISTAASYCCQLLLLALPTEWWLLQAVGCSWHYYCWLLMALLLSGQWQ